MSRTSLSSSGYEVGAKLAPKFEKCTYDCIKKPAAADLRKWMALLSSIVRNLIFKDKTAGGELEAFLDSKMGRQNKKNVLRPSFLDSSDFACDEDDISGISLGSADDRLSSFETETTESQHEPLLGMNPEGFQDASLPSFERRASHSSTPGNYMSLSPEAKLLDRMLFQNVLTMVNGEYYDLISDLNGSDARYTVAMYMFHQHAELSVSTRRLQALTSFIDWKYDGNPSKWKIDFINYTREVLDSGATIAHLMLLFAFKSFDGKNTQVQSMIAQDIDNPDTVHEGMSIETLATKYSSFLSTLAAGKPGSTNMATDYGREKGRKGDKGGRGGKGDSKGGRGRNGGRGGNRGGGKGDDKSFTQCGYCTKHHPEKASSHREKDCFAIAKDKAKNEDESAKATNSISDAAIADLCNRIKTGGIKLQQVARLAPPDLINLSSTTTTPVPENGMEECQAHDGQKWEARDARVGSVQSDPPLESGLGTITCDPLVAQISSIELNICSDRTEGELAPPLDRSMHPIAIAGRPINVASAMNASPHIVLSLYLCSTSPVDFFYHAMPASVGCLC